MRTVARGFSALLHGDPGCPQELRPCVVGFGYPEWDAAFSEGDPFRSRLIVAGASWSGGQHTLYGMIWAIDADAFAAVEADATAVIEGARLPAGVSQ
jgi:hypothetical protein